MTREEVLKDLRDILSGWERRVVATEDEMDEAVEDWAPALREAIALLEADAK